VAAAGPLVVAVAPTPSGTPLFSASKHYVVRLPVDGRREYLFEIAARLLGDGNRADEIFELNRGRPQPDGSALTDPAVLRPGWILVLPADASGPDVRIGPVPGITPPTPTPQSPTAAPAERSADLPRTVVLAAVTGTLLFALRALSRGRRLQLSLGRRLPVSGGPAQDGPDSPVQDAAPRAAARHLDPRGMVLRVEVETASGGPAEIHFVGTRSQGGEPPWQWLEPGEPPPSAATSVVVGSVGHHTLAVDLAHAPDVLTLAGDGPAGRRLATLLAHQLVARGAPVTVVGTALDEPPSGARTVASLTDAGTAADDPVAARVVFCPPVGEDDLPAVRRLCRCPAPRTVVVLVGGDRPSRWTVNA